MKKNRPSCWGNYFNMQNPEYHEKRRRAYEKHNVELPVEPDCPCRFQKSCIRNYNKLTKFIVGAINNPKSR